MCAPAKTISVHPTPHSAKIDSFYTPMALLRQALLVAVTAIIVAVIIPSHRKPSYPVPEIFGTVAPGFEEVREVFRQNYEDGWDNREAGSALSIYHEGEKVVDLWAGYADVEAKRLWKEDTLTIMFSSTKGLGALCIAMLADRGLLDFKKPVAYYWPEFAQKGKEKVTVEQLFAHEAGLYITDEPLSFDLLKDHKAMDKNLAESSLKWKPGTNRGYHGLTIGLYMDALIRRVDPKKRTVGRFFDEEVNKPFDIDAYIGLPLELFHRAARNIVVDPTWRDVLYGLWNFPLMRKAVIAMTLGSDTTNKYIQHWGDIIEFGRFADPDNLHMEIASASGMATARGVAKVYGILANGGKWGNKTLLSKEIIDEYATDKEPRLPDYVLLGTPMRWKYAMDIIPQANNTGNIFGAAGYGGQVGYADPTYKLGYGFLSRYNSPMGFQLQDPRFKRLQESVLKAIERKKRSE